MEITKKLVRQVLHQAFSRRPDGVMEIFAEAWCLRGVSLSDWAELEKHMLDNGLIEATAEEDYYRRTRKGEDVTGGEDY